MNEDMRDDVAPDGAEKPAAKDVQPSEVADSGPVPYSPQEDAELDKEIEEALGDASLMALYEMGGEQQESDSKADQKLAEQGLRRGKVVAIVEDGAFIDFGGKWQGLLPREEFEDDEPLQVGQQLEVSVLRHDARDGLLIVSKKTADQQLLVANLTEGAMVEARVTGSNKGGLELDIKGLKAFMPASQIDMYHVEDMDGFVGQKLICQVTQVQRGDRDIVLSRRNVLEQERQEQAQRLWDELEKGQTRHGVVRSITDYGAFIDLGGLDGLLHIGEMSWTRVKHASEILQAGQEIDVLVIGVDREKQRVSLSLRQSGGDPWTAAPQKYYVGSRHKAQIKNLASFGAFAELEGGVDGLIPISEMTWAGRIKHPSDIVQPGAMVEVEVLRCDAESRRISLSMKSLDENPWANAAEKYVVDNTYVGTVSRVADFGAFVTLESGVDGLIHISQLSDKHVSRVSEVVSEGKQVTVQVLSVDAESRRIALSMKSLDQTTAEADNRQAQENVEPTPKKKRKRPLRGGLTY